MNVLTVELEKSNAQYAPGEVIAGVAKWKVASTNPGDAEVHLLWHTEGKGTQDAEIVESITKPAASSLGEIQFRWTLPSSPYSYQGKLLSIVWKVELVLEKVDEVGVSHFSLLPNAPGVSESQKVEGEQGWFPNQF